MVFPFAKYPPSPLFNVGIITTEQLHAQTLKFWSTLHRGWGEPKKEGKSSIHPNPFDNECSSLMKEGLKGLCHGSSVHFV